MAIESVKLGHGGVGYVSGLFGVDPKTVRRGLSELEVTEGPRPSRKISDFRKLFLAKSLVLGV